MVHRYNKESSSVCKTCSFKRNYSRSFFIDRIKSKVKDAFDNLCENLGSEIEVLLKTPLSQIEKMGGAKLSEGIDRVRREILL